MTRRESINQRGYYNGWHAQQLQMRATDAGKTMAEVWLEEHGSHSAFNIPAVCEQTGIKWGVYKFVDGSKARVRRLS